MKRRMFAEGLVLLLLLSVLCSCGSSESSAPAKDAEDRWDAAASAETMDAGVYGENTAEAPGSLETPGKTGEARGQTDPIQSAKLIYTGSLEMETTGFDGVLESLRSLVTECGGYVESSSVSNRGSGYRYANFTVRIPAEQYGDFFTRAGGLCHVTWKNEEVQNITEFYYDTAGRLKTQQTKLTRLQELLSRAETMEDIITVESAISETEQTIEALSGELRHYDALVGYSTVYVSLSEVYKLSNTEEPATGFASRLGAAFASGCKGFVDFLEGLAVALAYGWVWLALLTVAAVVVIRRIRKKRAEIRGAGSQKTDDKPL